MFTTSPLLPGGYLPEVIAHGILTVSANSMFWRGRGGGGGFYAFFLILKGCNKGCLFMGGNKSYKIAGLTKHIILITAGLAQSVERLTAEGKVAGSIPGVGPILRVLK